jgi:hypothetical protein
MERKIIMLLVFAIVASYSCKNDGRIREMKNETSQNSILQQQDGTISLDVNKANTYSDKKNPQINTAEWSVVVSRSGRYNIWLTSATKDTTKLAYGNSVMLSIQDNRIEAKPTVDKIIPNAAEVSYPYYRADSFMGSLYIQDTGTFNIQIVSDKILPDKATDPIEDTRLLAVSLTPVTE